MNKMNHKHSKPLIFCSDCHKKMCEQCYYGELIFNKLCEKCYKYNEPSLSFGA